MAYNYSKLRGRIVEKYGTQSHFAKALRMSERSLSLKLNNQRYFTQEEISLATDLLDIPKIEMQLYFFTR